MPMCKFSPWDAMQWSWMALSAISAPSNADQASGDDAHSLETVRPREIRNKSIEASSNDAHSLETVRLREIQGKQMVNRKSGRKTTVRHVHC